MTDVQIIEMARQAGGEFYEGFAGSTNFVKFTEDDFEKFAKLVAEHEREACARVCDDVDSISDYYELRIELICAEAIRARGEI